MVSFEIFVKAMPPSLSELKVLPSFCFSFKIPDNVAVTNYLVTGFYAFSVKLDKIHRMYECLVGMHHHKSFSPTVILISTHVRDGELLL